MLQSLRVVPRLKPHDLGHFNALRITTMDNNLEADVDTRSLRSGSTAVAVGAQSNPDLGGVPDLKTSLDNVSCVNPPVVPFSSSRCPLEQNTKKENSTSAACSSYS